MIMDRKLDPQPSFDRSVSLTPVLEPSVRTAKPYMVTVRRSRWPMEASESWTKGLLTSMFKSLEADWLAWSGGRPLNIYSVSSTTGRRLDRRTPRARQFSGPEGLEWDETRLADYLTAR
jgi:hypothetical protein